MLLMSLVSGAAREPAENVDALIPALQATLRGEVDAGIRRRAEYSTDASNYRVVPQVVAFPADAEDVAETLRLAAEYGVPVTSRGGGTSVAGNAVGDGIVLDYSRTMNTIIDLDPEARTARVQPGVTLGALQQAAAPHGLRFGPDPSTWARCTLGGMIGNNACGSHSLSFGRTADNVQSLTALDGTGRRFTAGAGWDSVPGLEVFVSENLGLLRTELGQFGRQISGYSLEHLLPENGRHVARALVGTEGTCAAIVEAELTLVARPLSPMLIVLGYPDMPAAADAIPELLTHRPGAIEGLDARLVDAVRRSRGDAAVADLPRGGGWLLVEISGEDPAETGIRAEALARASGALDYRVVPHGAEARSIWRIREDGAGLAGRTPSGVQAWPGFEDAAVPPENLGAYLRDFEELIAGYGIEGMPYGHFGDGCIHVRLDIPLNTDGSVLRSLMVDAGTLVARYGGSLSGEHGDGRARSELLPLMYSPEMIRAFAGFKNLFDPDNRLNPGVVVDPAPLDVALRRPAALPLLSVNGFSFGHDAGDFTTAVHRCVGVGKCRVDNTASGGFMCPSFVATGDEKDSTRGRARVLQEMANGSLVTGGWSAAEVHDSLDLCLSCKACSSDCPAGVDMAAYKSEVLHRTFRGRLRPITHYVLGWLPRWARLASPFAPLINRMMRIPGLQRAVLWAGGMDSRRSIPPFAARSFSRSADAPQRAVAPQVPGAQTKRVLVWVDSFSDNFTPDIARDAITVLTAAGYEVIAPPQPVCCGLTWITTGQLTGARRILNRLLDTLGPIAEQGIPIVGLEPSCTAVLRSDLTELCADDPRAAVVAAGTYTLAELLTAPAPVGPENWVAPRLDGRELVVQPHCHHHAVMGFQTDTELLQRLGATVTALSGCCGLAGNFGMEKGHYEVSVAVAENALLPALRERSADSTFVADGFSCRTQANQLGGVDGLHLAQLLAEAITESARESS